MYLLDSSAVLAYLFDEPGGDIAYDRMLQGSITCINAAEVCLKLRERGRTEDAALAILDDLNMPVVEVGSELVARILHAGPARCGLSLGDRVCLAVAAEFGLTVVTTEKLWSRFAGEHVKVELIR